MPRWVLRATEVSGLRTPLYNSEAANKAYVDAGGTTLTGDIIANLPMSVSNGVNRIATGSDLSISISNYIGSTQSINRFADSSNYHKYFQASSMSYASYKHSANRNMKYTSVSSTRISGQWRVPLYSNLTAATNPPTATQFGNIIMTSGNASGTWVWIAIKSDNTTYQWNQLTYAT